MNTMNPTHRFNRWQAAALHLAISLCLAAIVGALLYFLWFPQPWFVAAGASTLILLLMGVDVCIGPLLTGVVFNPEKSRRHLTLDLAVIALVQAVAFIYGLHVITQARPVFVVAAVDRYILVAADQLADEDLAQGQKPAFRQRSWSGPQLVGAVPPKDAGMPDRVMAVMDGGKDIDQLPQFYVPYAAVADTLMQHALLLSRLAVVDRAQQDKLKQLQDAAKQRKDELRYLPLQRQDNSYTAIVSMKTRKPIAVLDIDPWQATR